MHTLNETTMKDFLENNFIDIVLVSAVALATILTSLCMIII